MAIIKKQELKHDLSIELLKHRIECYSLVMKYLDSIRTLDDPTTNLLNEFRKLHEDLSRWFIQEKGTLLMSEKSLRRYSSLISILADTCEKIVTNPDSDVKIEVLQVQEASRNFRVSLLLDVGVQEEKPKR